GRRSGAVMGASAASLGVLLGLVQLPPTSRFFGCRPLGPVGMAQALATSATFSTIAMVGPGLAEKAVKATRDRVRDKDVERVRALGRDLAESRWVRRLRGRGRRRG